MNLLDRLLEAELKQPGAALTKLVEKAASKVAKQKLKVATAKQSSKGWDMTFDGGGSFKIRPRPDGAVTVKLQGTPKPHYRFRGDGPSLEQALGSLKAEKQSTPAASAPPLKKGKEPKKLPWQAGTMPGPKEANVNGLRFYNDLSVDQETFDRYTEAAKDSVELLKKRGFGFMVKNPTMHLRKAPEPGMAGNYDMGTKVVEIFVDQLGAEAKPKKIMFTMVHELGHHYYYREISRAKRKSYAWYFDKAYGGKAPMTAQGGKRVPKAMAAKAHAAGAFPTTYGARVRYEDFAEIFAAYIGKGHALSSDYTLTKDIMQRFKSFMADDKRVDLREDDEGSAGMSLFHRITEANGDAPEPDYDSPEGQALRDEEYLKWLNGFSDPDEDRGDSGPDVEITGVQEDWLELLWPTPPVDEAWGNQVQAGGDDDMALYKKWQSKLDSYERSFFPSVYERTKGKGYGMSPKQAAIYWRIYNKMAKWDGSNPGGAGSGPVKKDLNLKFPPSKYQAAVFDWIKETAKKDSGALVVDAKAGAGKTSTIEAALGMIPADQSLVFLAFNKKIAHKLAADTEGYPNVLASTTSSFGYAALRAANKAAGLPHPALEDKKTFKIIDELMKDESKTVQKKYSVEIATLIDKRKMLVSTDDDGGNATVPSWADVAKKFKINPETSTQEKKGSLTTAQLYDYAEKAWDAGIADRATVDFADMVFLPAWDNLPFADKDNNLQTYNPDWVMVDESQDLSPTEASLVKRIAPRTVLVGDPNQSIYAFKGADPDSMEKLTKVLGAKTKPLSICYRCPKAVIKEAQRLVPEIEAAPGAKEGVIYHVAHEEMLQNTKPGDYVLCRTTAPLVSECLSAIAKGKKANVLGRKIGENLSKLIEKVGGKGADKMPIKDFVKKLSAWQAKESKRLEDQDKSHLIQGVEDKVNSLMAFMESGDVAVAGDIKKLIDAVFADSAPGIMFSTIHKAKGLEAPNIFIMRPDLLPHPTVVKKGTEADMQQEKNLEYVAITRAQSTLTWVAPPIKEKDESLAPAGRSLFERVTAR